MRWLLAPVQAVVMLLALGFFWVYWALTGAFWKLWDLRSGEGY